MDSNDLHAEKILELEFEYARDTVSQAVNDRTTVVNMYLLLVGGVGSVLAALAALSSSQQIEIPHSAFAIAFLLMGVVGFFTIFKLIRIRQAWHDSVVEMNRIKEFYIEHFPALEKAFAWRMSTIPPQGKIWSVTFILALLVAVIDSSAIGIATHLALGASANPWLDAVAFLAVVILQIGFYFYQLSSGELPTRQPGH
ncbi:MAG TPA: hypothetical protein VIX58_03895 [Anaerolineae bacterium]